MARPLLSILLFASNLFAGSTTTLPPNNPNACQAPQVVDITIPGSITYAYAINSRGDVAGAYQMMSGPELGFIRDYQTGVVTSYSFPVSRPATDIKPVGITDDGVVAGNFIGHGGYVRAFIRDEHGKITTIGTPFDDLDTNNWTWLVGINNDGLVAGTDNAGSFLRTDDGKITRLDPGLGIAKGPNDRGEVLGGDSTGRFFIRSKNGSMTWFTLSVPAPIIVAFNNSGDIAGHFGDAQGEHSFLRTRAGALTIFDLNWNNTGKVTRALCMNDLDDIAGLNFDQHDDFLYGDGKYWQGFFRGGKCGDFTIIPQMDTPYMYNSWDSPDPGICSLNNKGQLLVPASVDAQGNLSAYVISH